MYVEEENCCAKKTVYKNKAHFPILSFSLINHSINNNVFAAITFYLRFVDIVVDEIQLVFVNYMNSELINISLLTWCPLNIYLMLI